MPKRPLRRLPAQGVADRQLLEPLHEIRLRQGGIAGQHSGLQIGKRGGRLDSEFVEEQPPGVVEGP